MYYWSLSLDKKAKYIHKLLEDDYPNVSTPLTHKNEFELLIATMLSPQTKDVTTNIVTKDLFEKYPNATKLSKASLKNIEEIIKLVNFYKTKAKHIVKTSKILINDYNDAVPKEMNELIKLPGVGRKVANVIINEWFVKKGLAEPEGFVIDTHVLRVSQRLGLTTNTNVKKVEQDLMKLFPKKDWDKVSLRMIFHGREWSQARNPKYLTHPRKEWRQIYSSKKV